MIDEKKLIAEIKDYIEECSGIDENGMHNLKWCAMMEALGLVDQQEKVGEWIPCSERLPEKEAKEYIKEQLNGVGYLYPCLLTYKSPNTEKIHVVRFYYDVFQNWFVNSGEILCEKDRCLAWQPLPEPAKETTWAE